MDDLRWNNISFVDLMGSLESEEASWKEKVGLQWPNIDSIEMILHISSRLKLSRTTKYSAIRYFRKHSSSD